MRSPEPRGDSKHCQLNCLFRLTTMNTQALNTLRPRRNRRHLADDIFKCIFMNENVLISIKISLKFIPMGPINNIPTLVQIMAWCRPGDKPLSEPIIIISLMHICVARPQWVNMLQWSAQYNRMWYIYFCGRESRFFNYLKFLIYYSMVSLAIYKF